MDLLLLAQSVEKAEKGVGLLQTILAGGVPLICLCVAVLMGGFALYQMRRNNTLEREYRETVQLDAAARLAGTEKLLREQIDRDREANEIVTATIQAVEGFSHSLKEQQASCEATKRVCEEMVTQMRNLEETVRRFRDG